jgi:hypothetical protein
MPDTMEEGQPSERAGRRTRVALFLIGLAAVLVATLADLVATGQSGFGLQQWVLLFAGIGLAASSFGPLAICRALLILFLASAVALIGTEVVARVWLTERFAAIYGLDRQSLHALIPGAKKLFVHRSANDARNILVKINAQGFRGEEVTPKGRRRRIIVYGDSCVQGEFSELEDTFCVRMGRELGEAYQVINAGVIAYGPDQELVRLRRDLKTSDPDAVIVCLFADNDFGDLVRNKLFRVGASGELLPNEFTFHPDLLSQLQLARAGMMVERMLKRGLRRLRLEKQSAMDETDRASEARRIEGWLELCRAEYEEYLVRGDNVVRNLFDDHYDADISLDPGSDSARAKIELMEAVVVELQRECVQACVPLFLVILPSRLDLCSDLDLGWIDREAWPEYSSQRLSATLTDIAQRHAIEHISLFAPFQAADPCRLFFRGGDTHWNEAGQALAARLVAERLEGEGFFE